MTSGNTFWIDFLTAQGEQFKRRLWPFALAVLGYFLYYVVALSLVLTSYVTGHHALAERLERMSEAAAGMLGPNVFIATVTTVIAAVLSLQGFSWMHNRRTVDFYESHPVSRSRRFAQVCVNSFIIFIVSYAAALIIGILICCGFGIYDKVVAAAVFAGSVKAFALFASTFFIGVLSAALTGNALISVLAMGVLMVYEMVLRLTLVLYISQFLSTVVREGEKYYTSPLYYYVADGVWKPAAAMLLIGLVCAVAAFFCYRIRKNECAGRAVIFQPVRTVVKIAISVVGGLIAWNIFYSSGSIALSLLFMCFFVVVVGCTMQIIYDSDFKALFRRGWELAVAAAMALAIVVGFKVDILGIDTWMPDPMAVEDSAVHFSNSYYNSMLDEKGKTQGMREYAYSYMHLKDTDAVIALAQKGLEYTKNGFVYEEAVTEDDGTASIYRDVDITEYVVEYHMKGGGKVRRRYWLPYEMYPELMERITSDDGFQTGFFQVYHDDYIRENPLEFKAWYDNGQETKALDGQCLTAEFYQKFREAYLADLPQYGYKLDRDSLPVGSLVIQKLDNYDMIYYPVYECFENTISVLKEAGCFLDKIDLEAIVTQFKEEVETNAAGEAADGSDAADDVYLDPQIYDFDWYLFNVNSDAINGVFHDIQDDLRVLSLNLAEG